METDLPLDQLWAYRSTQTEPGGFADFWKRTLDEARVAATEPKLASVDAGLATLDVTDVTFSGFNGQPVRAWYRRPRGASEDLPLVVQYIGYGGGRGLPTENLLWASSGFAHLYVDTRGQGSAWSMGDTPDPNGSDPSFPGFLTRGILSPDTYYYRRVFTDAVRAVEFGRTLPGVDASKTFVTGGSQGGGISIAVSGLVPDLAGVIPHVPFLCDFPRAARIHDSNPYAELVHYLAVHRDHVDAAFETLRYFDGVNLGRHANAPARFEVALMDPTCKPSTVFGAYQAYAGEKQLEIHPFNEHEGGGAVTEAAAVSWAKARV